jgi:3-oxoacyl-[acyl-carrier protein] reductase
VKRFEGRTVLVTGASRGLGRAIAIAFASEGAFTVVHYRSRQSEAEATLASVRAAGADGSLLACDVRDESAVAEAMRGLLARGAIDVLVNNAATVHDAPVAMLASGDWNDVLATNLGGTFHFSRAVVRSMLARRSGAIVNVASAAALRTTAGQAAYAASKAGILALTRTMAAELGPKGVRVNAVVPGLLDTGMGERLARERVGQVVGKVPLGRAGTGEEVARAVLFLASEEASYVTGHALVVDGGLTL